MNPHFPESFYDEILKNYHSTDLVLEAKYLELGAILQKFLFQFSEEESLKFSNYFSRISYLSYKYDLSKTLQWQLNNFRTNQSQLWTGKFKPDQNDLLKALKTVSTLIFTLTENVLPKDLENLFLNLKTEKFESNRPTYKEKYDDLRVVVLDIDEENHILICRENGFENSDFLLVKYDQTIQNKFNDTVTFIKNVFSSRATLNLIDVKVDEDHFFYPKVIVLEPDYLVDVTAIAECFHDFANISSGYTINKFKPRGNTTAIMVGNIANFLLDQLMSDSCISFKEAFQKVFQTNTLAFADFDDEEMRKIYDQSKHHFESLLKVIKTDFDKIGVKTENCYLEPSFYSNKFGLQGRLDIWHKPIDSKKAAIIELKSGGLYKSNNLGLNHNHHAQTTLYDLLVRSVYKDMDVIEYLLYSKLENDQLKLSIPDRNTKLEVIRLRNELLTIDKKLSRLDEKPLNELNFLDKISSDIVPKSAGFLARDLDDFHRVIKNSSDLERRYFIAFTAFIAKEFIISKIGSDQNENSDGLASMWLTDFEEKNLNFSILSALEIIENNSNSEEMLLIFRRTLDTNPLANFRQGDIAVLYPKDRPEDSVMNHQIFKGSIISIDSEKVFFRLHSRQFNDDVFNQFQHWCLEHDSMDKSFNLQYSALYNFLNAEKKKKELLLTIQPPKKSIISNLYFDNAGLSMEQKNVLNKALSSEDYFLLVGPPGTGKTKVMLAEMVKHLLKYSHENILLLAYTNRAVDEICEAIHGFAEDQYLRLGSRYASDTRFEHRMFSVFTENIQNRKELKEIISKTRIFVSTVSTLLNRPLILNLKKFDTVIIDEASQILEPMLVGLLPEFKRFIMIGDHKQLPAVVLQDKKTASVTDEKLLEIGLSNRSNSIFERLYHRAEKNNWNWAFATLSAQGRMHQDICEFPNKYFYDGNLNLLPEESNEKWQSEPLNYKIPESNTLLTDKLLSNRVVFIPSYSDLESNPKTNLSEAVKVAEVVDIFNRIYQSNNLHFDNETIGVITPFRAQIAQIRQELAKFENAYDQITIDTVERYQGAARDIIIVSLCLNMEHQLGSLISVSDDEKVDRKLNVALTRARKHLVIIGNESIMKKNKHYSMLLEWISENNGIL